MQNYNRLTAFVTYAVIIAAAIIFASYLYVPHAAQQPLYQNAYAINSTSRYAYADNSDTTLSTLSVPVMVETGICDECGVSVSCPVGDCSTGNYYCPGTKIKANVCTGFSSTYTCGGTTDGTCPSGYYCKGTDICNVQKKCEVSYSCVLNPQTTKSTTSTSTSTTTSTTTSTSTTSTAFYTCDECFHPTKGYSCSSTCQYQSTGPTNGCPSGYIACAASPTAPKLECGLLPPSLSTVIGSEEPWYCPINQSIYLSWQNDIPIAIIVVLIAFLIAGGIFMVGAGIKNNKMRNFGIGELYEAVASAIMVALFVYLSAVIFGLIPGIFVGAINPYATSLHLITTTINSAENVYSGLFKAYDYDMFLSTLSVDLSVPSIPSLNLTGTVVKYALIPLDIYFIEPTAVVSGFIYDGILALYAEYYLIIFFAVASIPVFLIPGVILRALLPTRSLGGIMIALAAGFYFIMPLLFAVAFYFTAPHVATQMNDVAALLNGYSIGKGAVNNAVTPTSPLVRTLSTLDSSLDGFWLLILFYPALISAVTYAFVVQLASFIGGAARMSGRARAKFI